MTPKNTSTTNPYQQLTKLSDQYQQLRLQIKAGQNKNTNAHLPLKKQIAQLLTKLNTTNH